MGWFSSLLKLTWVSPKWRLPIYFLAGLMAGLSLVIFRISAVTSYLSDDPKACINCHIMVPQYAAWERSSHRAVASCNDCHVPHDNLAHKLFYKAKDGTRHGFMFTFNLQPQAIHASKAAIPVIQENCLRCHGGLVRDVFHSKDSQRLCWECHRNVPHGDVRSLSSSPEVRRPHLKPVLK